MGRKSLANKRTEQILDAFAVCLRQDGFAGCTLERVAEAAGVQRSLIRHYIGNRDELITAAVDRIIAAYQAELAQAIDSLPRDALIPALLDYLFCPDDASEINDYDVVINALWASHNRDPHIHKLLLNFYQAFENLLNDSLAHAYPNAEPTRRQTTAYAIMCLANDSWSMVSLGFPQSRFAAARSAAEQLIAALTAQKI